jgi:hypothetical protein
MALKDCLDCFVDQDPERHVFKPDQSSDFSRSAPEFIRRHGNARPQALRINKLRGCELISRPSSTSLNADAGTLRF